ncbi:flavin reductase family protein [Agromyces aerolatus]|uniref:flavin reductase family protein n=1 Tax=Agromyces sp. LY-1074 TaxID=3074080 RepID=UPI0028597BE0|nr:MULTISPECIES: flavin reductase family protein [unclassified Agromyces]MDR5699460.1 flavin reductase family protein [Agromyces sp. LY-1074]MDR5705756.1 flavin reductase family protein [Agromyces sp. LY-1358]
MTITDARVDTFGVEEFRAVFRNHPGPVAVITLRDLDGRPVGFTATSVISISASPAVVGFSIMQTSSSWPALAEASSVVVHFLDVDDVAISRKFAVSGIDRFEGLNWRTLPTGEPVLPIHGTWVRARVLGSLPVGSSFFVHVEPVEASITDRRRPLVYHDRKYHELVDASMLSE